MAGYIRQDTTNNIANGNIINANDLDNEYDAIAAAFGAITGHKHDGTDAEGAPITKVGPVQDVVVSSTAVTPKTDNTVDLGSSTNEFKDLYIDGVANIDSLVADTADINGGTIDNASVGATTPSTGAFTTLTSSSTTTLNGTSIPASKTLLVSTDIGVSVQGYDADLAAFALKTAPTGDVVGTSDAQTLTNKTLTSPVVSGDLTVADKIVHAGDTNTAVRFPAADTVTIETDGVERVRVDSAGNVGVGTSSPGANLDVTGSNGVLISASKVNNDGKTGRVKFQHHTNAEESITGLLMASSATTTSLSIGGGSLSENAVTEIRFYTAANNTTLTGTQAGTIGSNGNWSIGGIGTAAYRLSVVGDSSNNLLLGLTENVSGNGARLRVYVDDTSGVTFNSTNTSVAKPIVFTRGVSSETARMDASGNFMVGQVGRGLQASDSFGLDTVNGTAYFNHENGKAAGSSYHVFGYNATLIGSITQSGTTGVAYNTSSDYRLKHDIAPMQGALARVKQLKPVTYKWNADGSDGEGFIAHELAEVCPQAVTGEKDGVDDDGNPIYQGIDTSFLVATLTAAIQEQQAIIEQLRNRVEVLEAK